MTQQINLFARLPKEEEVKYMVSNGLLRTLTAAALASFAFLFLLNVGKTIYGSYTQKHLQADLKTLETNLAKLEAEYPEETKLLLQERGQKIQQEIQEKKGMLDVMKTELSDIPGFVAPLESLANQITAGVWLTEIQINHDEKFYRFKGNAFQVDQVLAFINNLGQDAFFSGEDFKVFEVLQTSSEEGYISFILATE